MQRPQTILRVNHNGRISDIGAIFFVKLVGHIKARITKAVLLHHTPIFFVGFIAINIANPDRARGRLE